MKKTMGIDGKISAKPAFRCPLASVVLLLGFFFGPARGENKNLYRTEEIAISAGDFSVVGDLYLPLKGDRHPLVVWVHGSGPLTRKIMVPLLKPQIEVFLKAGFAFFIDDIPGAGGSKGSLSQVYRDRAMILCKEVETLRRRPDIVPEQVGVAGHSQAGVVMPLALKSSSGSAVRSAEACPAENAAEQESYLLEKYLICEGYPPEEARKAGQMNSQRYYAQNYKDYREAAEYINNHPAARLHFTQPLVAEYEFSPRQESSAQLQAVLNRQLAADENARRLGDYAPSRIRVTRRAVNGHAAPMRPAAPTLARATQGWYDCEGRHPGSLDLVA